MTPMAVHTPDRTRVLAVIPARGGSKRIPGKNLRKVGGTTLVGRAIISAMQSELVTDVCVSTDHPDIQEEAWHWLSRYRHKGKHSTVLNRKAELSTDTAPLDAVIVDAYRYVSKQVHPLTIQKVVTLQPTSPLRPDGLIDECIKLQEHPINSVLTVHDPGHFMWKVNREHPTVPFRYQQLNATNRPNSQDLGDEKLWAENGCVYVTDSYALMILKTRVAFHSMVYPISLPHAVDIDTEADFQLAEALAKAL